MMRSSLRLLLRRGYSHAFSLSQHSHFIRNTTPLYHNVASNVSSTPSDDKPNKEFKVTLDQFFGTDNPKRLVESETKREILRAMENNKCEDLERKLKGLKIMFSSETIAVALQLSAGEPNEACAMFSEMKQRSGIFEIDERVYNVMSGIIVEEEDERFWNLVMDIIHLKFGLETGNSRVLRGILPAFINLDKEFIYNTSSLLYKQNNTRKE